MVTLNRCMYAQLEQQEFEAPSGFSMPPAKSPQHSAAQRGMKLSCGFEMLYAKSDPAEVHPTEIARHFITAAVARSTNLEYPVLSCLLPPVHVISESGLKLDYVCRLKMGHQCIIRMEQVAGQPMKQTSAL